MDLSSKIRVFFLRWMRFFGLAFGEAAYFALVAQGTERRSPEPGAQVRVLPRALTPDNSLPLKADFWHKT